MLTEACNKVTEQAALVASIANEATENQLIFELGKLTGRCELLEEAVAAEFHTQ